MIPGPIQLIFHDSGGGRELNASGQMVRTKGQEQSSRQHRAVMNAFEQKLPISVVIGKKLHE